MYLPGLLINLGFYSVYSVYYVLPWPPSDMPAGHTRYITQFILFQITPNCFMSFYVLNIMFYLGHPQIRLQTTQGTFTVIVVMKSLSSS